MSFRPAGIKPRADRSLGAPGTLHSFRHLQIFGSFHPCLSRKPVMKDRPYDPGRPKSRHTALI
ncbi:hypothetical protein [Methanosarcina mazei]|uniref:hypothetical protein n=1 Tax=Methanosarcina mazei TaxID=2209 RepID=UPI00064E5CC1|nr:hypothetical protein [Methanosarcina mazei]